MVGGVGGSGKATSFLNSKKGGDGGFHIKPAIAKKLGSKGSIGVGDAAKLGDKVCWDFHKRVTKRVKGRMECCTGKEERKSSAAEHL